MPRTASRPPVVCAFFSWQLFRRDGVYYADGRGGAHQLGKHSLGTRDHDQALANLRQLDRHMAARRGLAPAVEPPASDLTVARRLAAVFRSLPPAGNARRR